MALLTVVLLTDSSRAGAAGVARAVQTAQGGRGALSHLQLHTEEVSKQSVSPGYVDV